MRVIYTLSLLLFLSLPAIAEVLTMEELANSILKERLAILPRVGNGGQGDDVFYMELDVQLYQAAIDSKDVKLKALVAIKALESMPHFLKEGEDPPSPEERARNFCADPQYKALKAWISEMSQ